MKKTAIAFVILLATFFIAWGVKVRTPVNRPDNIEEELYTPWYESDYSSPVPDEEWVLDPTIPDNYVPVPGEENLFMVVDESGNISAYRKRIMQDDGVWAWEDVNPDIPNNYELVNGSENLYKVTNTDGSVEYFLYVRNEDGSYCFVACDEFGIPHYNGEDAEVIASNYIHEENNIYAVYNEDGVKEGYVERKKDEEGAYVWVITDYTPPVAPTPSTDLEYTHNTTTQEQPNLTTETPSNTSSVNTDGTYVVTNKSTNTVTENGYNVTYKTIVYNTYDKDGNLLYTKQEGPYEISREKVAASETPNPELIEATLDGEYNRVSSQVTYNPQKANEVLAKLNAERANQGLSPLTMNTDSEAYKLACIRAADMCIYNYSAADSPLYGNLDAMVARWGCYTANASENIWKAGTKTADEIHTRLQAYDGSRNIRMSASYTEVGIAIVEQDGQIYIAEVYLY